eukprot:jgi/Chlat1/8525/Chrsp80S07817
MLSTIFKGITACVVGEGGKSPTLLFRGRKTASRGCYNEVQQLNNRYADCPSWQSAPAAENREVVVHGSAYASTTSPRCSCSLASRCADCECARPILLLGS